MRPVWTAQRLSRDHEVVVVKDLAGTAVGRTEAG